MDPLNRFRALQQRCLTIRATWARPASITTQGRCRVLKTSKGHASHFIPTPRYFALTSPSASQSQSFCYAKQGVGSIYICCFGNFEGPPCATCLIYIRVRKQRHRYMLKLMPTKNKQKCREERSTLWPSLFSQQSQSAIRRLVRSVPQWKGDYTHDWETHLELQSCASFRIDWLG